jgi:hypothetical protein
LRPWSVTREYLSGPDGAIFVPVKSSSSKTSRVPDKIINEEMRFSQFPQLPPLAHEVGVIPRTLVPIEGDDLGQRARTAEFTRHRPRGQPAQNGDEHDHDLPHRSLRAPLRAARIGQETSGARPAWLNASAYLTFCW